MTKLEQAIHTIIDDIDDYTVLEFIVDEFHYINEEENTVSSYDVLKELRENYSIKLEPRNVVARYYDTYNSLEYDWGQLGFTMMWSSKKMLILKDNEIQFEVSTKSVRMLGKYQLFGNGVLCLLQKTMDYVSFKSKETILGIDMSDFLKVVKE